MTFETDMSYEYILISWFGTSASGLTNLYTVNAARGGALLGHIKWFYRWRQYSFYPAADTIYSAGCLRDIASFIEMIRDGRKKKHPPEVNEPGAKSEPVGGLSGPADPREALARIEAPGSLTPDGTRLPECATICDRAICREHGSCAHLLPL